MVDPRIIQYRDAANEMTQGDYNVTICGADSDDEIAELGRALTALAHSLKVKFEQIAALNRITHQVNSVQLLDEALDCVYETFRSVIPYERIGVAFLEEEDTFVRAYWSRSDTSSSGITKGYSARMAGSSLQTVLDTNRPRILNDLVAYLEQHPDSASTRLMVKDGMRSSLTCPLVAFGNPVGFLFFSSRNPNTYKEIHQDVFLKIADQLSVIIEKARLIQQLQDLNEQLMDLAVQDPLTGLLNRRAILELLDSELSRAKRQDTSLFVLMIDLDNFKMINDTRGHLTGDAVLRETASRMRLAVRSYDRVGRYGGEEFLIISPNRKPEDAHKLAERIRLSIAQMPVPSPSGDISVTASVGVAVSGTEGRYEDANHILRASDDALYRAKSLGRNRVEFAKYEGQREYGYVISGLTVISGGASEGTTNPAKDVQ